MRAPELVADGWLNVADDAAPPTLASLRGRFVILDFWTFCCANCLHVIDELRPVEVEHRDILTVIGVHSPKFAHEAEPTAVEAAVERYDVGHPVLLDTRLDLWRHYAVRAWPTLVLIDPEGYVIAHAAGEGQASALSALITAQAPAYERRGTLRRGDAPSTPVSVARTSLRYPAKAIVVPADRTGRDSDSLLVADAGHHQLVELGLDGRTVLRRIGDGRRGRADGPAHAAQFAEPNGLALLPTGVADFDIVVADTANHLLRGVRLSDGAVVTTIELAQLLEGAHTITGAIPAVLSPWDVAWWPARQSLVVAAAGVHLLLSVVLPADSSEPVAASVLAGTTVEGLRDGPALEAWLAQPSGLAVDGDRIWFVDAETSALRYLTAAGQLHTAVGEGLFDFGHLDGPASLARMQHPLGVLVAPDGGVLVCDTYNGAVRRWDGTELSTVAVGLAEPSGGAFVDGRLVVVASAAHAVVAVDPAARSVHGPSVQTQRPPIEVAADAVALRIAFTPPPGRSLDDRYGPATQLTVTASPSQLLRSGAGTSTELSRELEFDTAVTGGVLHVSAQAASCDKDPSIEHPACYLARQDWGVPVTVTADGAADVELVLLG